MSPFNCGMGRRNLRWSYWEWCKLIAAAFLISCGMTGAPAAIWWLVVE
jgi:hypothetical protein